jgi:hypothetical protein
MFTARQRHHGLTPIICSSGSTILWRDNIPELCPPCTDSNSPSCGHYHGLILRVCKERESVHCPACRWPDSLTTDQSRDNDTWRYMIIFADRETADGWRYAVDTANYANLAASNEHLTPPLMTGSQTRPKFPTAFITLLILISPLNF